MPDAPTNCDKVGARLGATYGEPGQVDSGNHNNCPPGGCLGYGDYRCPDGWMYNRNDGWCYHPENLLDPGPNVKPQIRISWPPHNSYYPAPVNGPVNIESLDPDGQVYRVDFFVNSQLAYTTFDHPFTWWASGVGPGTYVVEAVAYDHNQEYTISAPVTVYVY